MLRTSAARALVLSVAALTVHCGDDGGSAPDGADGSLGAPEIRDVRVGIDGGAPRSLIDSDVRTILPETGSAEFTVQATDDETEPADLVVEVTRADGAPAEGQMASFRNGLWRVELPVSPGQTLRVAVTDEAGRRADTAHALVVPSLPEAVEGTYERRDFATDQTVLGRVTLRLGSDGSWRTTEADDGPERTGTFEVRMSDLILEQRTSTADTELADSDEGTVERRQESTFFVDSVYFDPRPFMGGEGQEELEGSWERSYRVEYPASTRPAEEVTERLVFGEDGTWTSETTTSADGEAGETAEEAGTFEIELNDNYTESDGDFLLRTVETRNGEPIATVQERFELHVIRRGRLLLGPYLRQSQP